MAVNTDYSFIDPELKLASRFVLPTLLVDAGGVSQPLIDTDKWTGAAVPAVLSCRGTPGRGPELVYDLRYSFHPQMEGGMLLGRDNELRK